MNYVKISLDGGHPDPLTTRRGGALIPDGTYRRVDTGFDIEELEGPGALTQ